MSFGFSPSDFIVAYELARKIHHRCFTKAQRAGKISYIYYTYLTRPRRDDSASWLHVSLSSSFPSDILLTYVVMLTYRCQVPPVRLRYQFSRREPETSA